MRAARKARPRRRAGLSAPPQDAASTLLSDASHFEGAVTVARGAGVGRLADDPFARVFPARLLSVDAGHFGAAPPPYGPTIERYGSALAVEGTLYRAFPEPTDLLARPPDDLVAVVATLRKGEYLLDAARAFADVDEAWLRAGPLDEVYRWLRRVKGLGEWSAAFSRPGYL